MWYRILVKRGEGNTNLPEFSLLKFLLLIYHHSHFLATTLDFTFFLRAANLFTAGLFLVLDKLLTAHT